MVCSSSIIEIYHWVLESVTLLLSMEYRQSADEPVVGNLYVYVYVYVYVCVCVCV